MEQDLVEIYCQLTPNPNAYKFIVSDYVTTGGKAGFKDQSECDHVPLAHDLLGIAGVAQVHLFENVITVTQDGARDWGQLAEEVERLIVKLLPQHNPDFALTKPKNRDAVSADVRAVEEILDRTIRPALQSDGGDVEVVEVDGSIVTIHYEGACGSCPSSQAGTLHAITSFLREEWNPAVEVVTV